MEQGDRTERFDEEKARLKRLLLDCSVDITVWGTGDAKTLDQLVKEVVSGESRLMRGQSGELTRSVEVVQGVITYVDENGDTFQLVEDKQVFGDDRVRVRDHLSDISVAEKMKPGEDPREALICGILEELGIEEGVQIAEDPEVGFKDEDSASYPGLRSQYQIYTFAVELDASAYKPEGYAEVQDDKTNFFVWKKVDS